MTLSDSAPPAPAPSLPTRSPGDLAQSVLERVGARTPSLIVTIWGDTIAAHGASVWLGSLIRLLEGFGLNDRVVRTAVYRLQKDGWLQSRQVGRRSYYELAPAGRRRSAAASTTIYRGGALDWDGTWLILVHNRPDRPSRSDSRDRERLRRDLVFMGFGSPAPGIYLHPVADWAEVKALLAEHSAGADMAIFRGDNHLMPDLGPLQQLVTRAWDNGDLEAGYRGFIDTFKPVMTWLKEGGPDGLSPADAFLLRTLLIHEFRRMTLRDPLLPPRLMPDDWPGPAALDLTAGLYRLLQGPATAHAMSVLESEEGTMPPPGPSYYDRYGGLDRRR